MKKRYGLLLFVLFLLAARMTAARAQSRAEKPLTLIVYMCGSNLESEGASATRDLEEMENAGFDESKLNVLVMTGGSRRWHNGQSGEGTVLTQVGNHKSRELKEESPPLSMGDPETLAWLMRFARERYPAQSYALILWDHGAGPLGGVCLDEQHAPDRLTLDELGLALEAAGQPEKLRWIGFDACLMSTVEVASALSPWADYLIASQETEPSAGWDYSFLRDLAENPELESTARRIIDLYIESQAGSESLCTLACTDLSRVAGVVGEMNQYFASLADLVSPERFSWFSERRGESVSFGKAIQGTESSGYDLVDLKSLISLYGESNGADRLEKALGEAVVYHRENRGESGGLSVYHPYQNKDQYLAGWALEYRRLGFCSGYTDYLLRFGTQLLSGDGSYWRGLDGMRQEEAEGDGPFFSLQLTPEQQTSFLQAQLVILRPWDSEAAAVFSGNVGEGERQWWYSPVAFAEAEIDEKGRVTARYSERALYVTDESGEPLVGPLAWRLSEDGKICVQGRYMERTGRENAAEDASVLFVCEEEKNGSLRILRREIYDPLTERFTERLAIQEENYSDLSFDPLASRIPTPADPIPGLDKWGRGDQSSEQISLGEEWRFQFLEEQISGAQLFAAFEITDYWQNTWMCPMIPVENPNLIRIDRDSAELVLERAEEGIEPPRVTITETILADTSRMNPSLLLCLEFTAEGLEKASAEIHNLTANGHQSLFWYDESGGEELSYIQPGFVRRGYFRIPGESLRGLENLTELSFRLDLTTDWGGSFTMEITGLSCPLDRIAPAAGPALAEAAGENLRLELAELREEKDGSLTAAVRVENDTETLFSAADWELAAEGITGNLRAEGSVLPGTDGYCLWHFENRASLYGLSIEWKERRGMAHLGRERLLQGAGLGEVHTLQLLRAEEDGIRTLTLSLENPFPLRAGAPATAGEDLLLLDQEEIRVWAERVLIGSNGAGIRLRAENLTDRPILLTLGDRMIQGLDAENNGEESMLLPAGGTACRCIHLSTLNLLPIEHIVDQLGFSFAWEDRRTDRAVIRLTDTVRINDRGGAYLAASGTEVTPAEPAEVRPERILARSESGDFAAELTALDTGLHGELIGRVRLTNRTEGEVYILHSSMMAEDTVTDALLNHLSLAAGETGEFAFVYENASMDDDGRARERNVLQRHGYGAVSRLTFFLGTNEAGGGAALTIPMTLEEPFRLTAAEESGAGESRLIAEKDGVRLFLRSVGLVSNYIDSMNMTFEIENETEEERYIQLSGVKVGGQTWGAFLEGWVPAHSRKTVTAHFYVENEKTMRNELDQLSFYADLRGDGYYRFPTEPVVGQEMFLVEFELQQGILFSRRAGTELRPEEYEITSEYVGAMEDNYDGEWW